MRGAGSDRAGAALGLPAQRVSVGMGEGLVNRVAEHVVEEAQQALEGPGRSVEHMFVSVGWGSDGNGALQRILHDGATTRTKALQSSTFRHSEDQISSFVRTRSTTASVNSVVPAWPPRSGVLIPDATVSSAAS